ncbi:DUF3224 domain-containing protein [Fulvimonas sp. R45]|uniref:DUF3224 domain-containing protein n=1 Tax=Fulvimonas sp. R45 TaxID=3045937 RepID=UPI00265EE803|nr:DUF3224 domain-containing protein [Fulvimonas sp. R45]MDO1529915.1 DUF3224 domain-containing protein [Fulvimonas sp. R45]
MQAQGRFDVTLTPQPADPGDDAACPGRRRIDKHFHGELEAHSRGQMLAVGTAVPGSAGYVALERVAGTLHGRRGSFALQHHGLMKRGESSLVVVVVPDSGTGELAGLEGAMTIRIEDGQHHYTLDYRLP